MASGTRIDYYAVLEVERTATATDIKRAFRQKVRSCHPDANPGDPDAERRFKEVNEAYAVLSDPEQRARYDQFGSVENGAGPFEGFDGEGLFGDLFDLFGGMGGRSGGPRQGGDLQMGLSLTLEEAARGTSKKVTVSRWEPCDHCEGSGAEPGSDVRTCPTCGGTGQVRTRVNTLFGQTWSVSPCPHCGGKGKTISQRCRVCGGEGRVRREREQEIRIAAGVDSGLRLRVSGAGQLGERGGPPGDLYIVLTVADHPRFQRDDDDLHVQEAIDFPLAVMGGSWSVETLIDGAKEVKVAAGSQPGTVVRLKGLGMPRLRGFGRGDLYVHFTVSVPEVKDLPPAAQEALLAYGRAMKPMDGEPEGTAEGAEPPKPTEDDESLLGKLFGSGKKKSRKTKKK